MADDDLRKLAVDLRGAGQKAQRMAGRAVRKAAFDIEAIAKTKAPVDTGALRNSIGADFTASDGLTAMVGPTVNYAKYQEFGTRYITPQPFMGPAADIVGPQFEQAMAEIGGRILD